MKLMGATTKAEKAREIVRRIEANLEDAIGLEAMLSRSNDDPTIRKAYDNTPAVHGCNTIRHCLIIQITVVLMRIHDPGTGNKASLPHLFKLLKDRKVLEEFRRDALAWYREGLVGSGEKSAIEVISDARTRWEIIKEQEPNKRLRKHRNRYIAHTLIEMLDEKKAMFKDVFDLLEDTIPIVEWLLLGTLGKSREFDEVRKIKWKQADAFWSSAVAGVEVVRGR